MQEKLIREAFKRLKQPKSINYYLPSDGSLRKGYDELHKEKHIEALKRIRRIYNEHSNADS